MNDFLLLPMQPTPNGRLHLGHIAGPYLQCDILARILRQKGASVSIICGADVYENWVLLPAMRAGSNPVSFCQQMSDGIQEDLGSLSIVLDEWIDPFVEPHKSGYEAVNNLLLANCIETGRAELSSERIPYSPVLGAPATGVWLLGKCPNCGKTVGGNCCENCGCRFEPEEIVDPIARDGFGPLCWEPRTAWYAPLKNDTDLLNKIATGINDVFFQELAKDYLSNPTKGVRLTSHGNWGIPNTVDKNGEIVANTFFGFCLYCADVYARQRQVGNPLAAEAKNVKVYSFTGLDNLVAATIAPQVISACASSVRPFDIVFMNRFMTLDGEKFSTSRKHGVWVQEILTVQHVTGDDVRLYIASKLDGTSEPDFSASEFVELRNTHRRILAEKIKSVKQQRQIARPNEAPATPETRPYDWIHLENNLRTFTAQRVFQEYWEHLNDCQQVISQPDIWLSRLVALAQPLLPKLASQISAWVEDGLQGGHELLSFIEIDVKLIEVVVHRQPILSL